MAKGVTHIVMLEMTQVGVCNGVTRCIQTLANALGRTKQFKVTWLRIVYGFGYQEQLCHIPVSFQTYRLPIALGTFLSDAAERTTCWDEISNFLSPQIQGDTTVIYHVHTLNLIELASFLKERVSGKIITHLHCIPWKTLYDRNYQKYHTLYKRYYVIRDLHPINDYMYGPCEWLAYRNADAIVCVSQSGHDFLRTIGIPEEKIHIVCNGLADISGHNVSPQLTKHNQPPVLLFVGNSNPSKGLNFLLQALSNFKDRTIKLIVIGNFPFQKREQLLSAYPHIDIQFTGQLSLDEMVFYYSTADMGIIPSIHEQCSYTAIEMMVFGLPIVCTDVDGLGEFFRQGVNALKVPLLTPSHGRQKVDTDAISKAIHAILCQPSLREQLSKGCRKAYLKHFTEKQMIQSIEHIYSQLKHLQK